MQQKLNIRYIPTWASGWISLQTSNVRDKRDLEI
jgi:hypothetical protein